jgi:dipeptidyl aminopeptidase/acylaminoacyl peptidase
MLRVCSNFVAAGAALVFLANSHAAALPPVDAFGRLPNLAEPKLSPDGKHLAVIRQLRGRPAAVIYDLEATEKVDPKVVSDNDGIIYDVDWAKNDRLLITINMNQKAAGDTKVQSWYRTISVDTNGANMVLLFGNSVWRDLNYSAAQVADYNLGDPDSIFMPLYAPAADDMALSLYRVNVHTGDASRVMTGSTNTDDWIMDGNGHVVGREDETKHPLVDHLKILRGDDWNEIGSYDATGGQGSGVIGLSLDGKSLVQTGTPKDGTKSLTLLDMATGKESLLYANPSYDVDEALTDPWTGRVIGVAFADDRMEYRYFDPDMQKLQFGLEKSFPGLSVHAVSWDLARDRVIVEVEGPRQPTAYYFLDRTTHDATRISSSYPDLAETDLGEMKPYPFKARDGVEIPAYLTLPPGKEARNLPTVIFPHGGPGARDEISFDWWAQFMANRGYAVLQPNFRGSTGYGIKFEEAGYGEWGLKMQDDVTDGVKKLIADGIADPKRICIVGASYGGYAALAGAAFTPDLYACAISFAGLSDLGRFLRTRASDYGSDSWMISTWSLYIGNRYSDSTKLDAASPAFQADRIKCPVLLIHAAGDTTVRIDQSQAMNDALTRLKKPVEFINIDGDSHYMLLADTRIRVLKEAEAFLQKNIGN